MLIGGGVGKKESEYWRKQGGKERTEGREEGTEEKKKGGGGGSEKTKREGLVDVALAVGRGVSYLTRAALQKHPWVAVSGATTTLRAA